LRALGLHCTEAEVRDIIVVVDSDGSGKLDFSEFINLMVSR
jgi:Ca2+-binding EF-hand superfamily protein